MNRFTLYFKDVQVEQEFNQQEEASFLHKLSLNIIAMIFMAIVILFFWISIGSITLACISISGIFSMVGVYYLFIFRRMLQKYRNLLISSLSMAGPIYSVVLRTINLNMSEQDILILEDALIVLVFSLLITNSFTLNTGQFLIFVISRIIIRIHYQFNYLIVIVIVFSLIIVHNDYQKIKNTRKVFLLKRYNNNQLDIIDNLEQPILLLKFQKERLRLTNHFMNRKFQQLIKQIDSIEFIRSCFVKKFTSLYTYILQNIDNLNRFNSFKVKSELNDYQIILQAYQGQNLLIALEFKTIKKLDVLAQPYFYKSVVKYLQLNNHGRYRQEVMKNICGFLLYRPKLCKFPIQQIKIQQLVWLIHPNIYETNIQATIINSSKQLFIIFLYLLYQSFKIDKLIIIQTENDLFKFSMTGFFNSKLRSMKSLTGRFKVLNEIINILGQDDLQITANQCIFTLTHLQQDYILI